MKYYENELYISELNNLSKNIYLNKKLKDKTIVITGARGLIGSELVDAIMYANTNLELNCKVYAVVRKLAEAEIRFSKYMQSDFFHLVKSDINTDSIDIEEDIDYFVHGASNTHPLYYATKPIETILTSTLGTNNTLKFAAEHRCVRYIYISSVEVYGENRGDIEKFTEKYCGYIDSNTLRAGYPEGKRAGESLCQAYREEYKLDCVIPRVARCYGPGLLAEDSKALTQFLKNAVSGKDIVLKSAGKQFFSYVYVADAVDAIITLLAKGENGEAYNIVGRDSDVTLAELAAKLASNVGRKVVYEMPSAKENAGYSKATKAVMSGDKMKEIGWQGNYSLETGLRRTIDFLMKEEN